MKKSENHEKTPAPGIRDYIDINSEAEIVNSFFCTTEDTEKKTCKSAQTDGSENESEQVKAEKNPGKRKSISQPVYPEAEPFFLEGGSTAVLIIHGYLGSPYDVRYLAEKLFQSGYTVSVPRLPGHGTCREDFITKGKKEWLDEVYKSYTELKKIYSEVVIAGFSMGGLLAIHAASEFKPERLILIAPALTNKRKLMFYSTPLLKYFRKTLNKNCRIKTYNDYEEYLKNEYWSKDWIKAVADIVHLQLNAKKLLKKLESEILLLISESDNTVPVEVSEIVRRITGMKNLTEKRVFKSNHMIFHSGEKDNAVSMILDWLNRN